MVISSFPDLCVRSVPTSVEFYRRLLGLELVVDHGWYAEMGVGRSTLLAFVEVGHETVPAIVCGPPRGVLVSFEVDDANAIATMAKRMGCPIPLELVSELGQMHLMVVDPDGAVVDVIQRVPLTAADMRRLVRLRRSARC